MNTEASDQISQLLVFTIEQGASDLHLSPKQPPILRVDGELRRIKTDPISSDQIKAMLYTVMTEEQRSIFENDREIDFSATMGDLRFRVNAYTSRNGTAAAFRAIPDKIPSLDDLDAPPALKRLAELEKGLILLVGPTGSGKSTTLAAMVNHINTKFKKHILTIEDPVEFFHTSKTAMVNHREVGTDTLSFARALKSALREDPDVILVGEMRDLETISLALTAAETGHLVLATLHANSAYKAIDRMIDVFPAGDKDLVRAMTSNTLQAAIAQTLLKRADGKGRVAAHEILIGTNAVRNLIRENQISQIYSMIQVGGRHGMQTMEDAVAGLLDAGVITEDEAGRVLVRATGEGRERGDENDETTSVRRSQVSVSTRASDPTRLRAADNAPSKVDVTDSTGKTDPQDENYSF